MVSICLPVYSYPGGSKTFEGVTCSDMSMSEVAADVEYFKEGAHSYAFLIDNTGRTLMHPLLPRPSEVNEAPIYLGIGTLETYGPVKEVIHSMMR